MHFWKQPVMMFLEIVLAKIQESSAQLACLLKIGTFAGIFEDFAY